MGPSTWLHKYCKLSQSVRKLAPYSSALLDKRKKVLLTKSSRIDYTNAQSFSLVFQKKNQLSGTVVNRNNLNS